MYTDIDSDVFREEFGNRDSGEYQLIDVREQEEYAAAHIPGALNIPLSELPARFDEISEESPALLSATQASARRRRRSSWLAWDMKTCTT